MLLEHHDEIEEAETKSIPPFVDIPDVTATADHEMVSFVFRNLLSHGIKFTPRGGSVGVSATISEGSIGSIRFILNLYPDYSLRPLCRV
ncbi:MAG: hypothetical protein WD492_11780 [Alkalispirochaeta sp.]